MRTTCTHVFEGWNSFVQTIMASHSAMTIDVNITSSGIGPAVTGYAVLVDALTDGLRGTVVYPTTRAITAAVVAV